MKLHTYFYIVLVAVTITVAFPTPAFAGLLPDCNPVPGGPSGGRPTCNVGHLIDLAVGVYNWLLSLAAFVFILMIIITGMGMLSYSFFEEPEKILSASKTGFRRAITGFVIIACAYLIVNILLVALGVTVGTPVGDLLRTYGLI